MFFVLLGLTLIALKLFQVTPFSLWSWWWVALPLVLAAIWFEIVEPLLGLDVIREKKQIEKMTKQLILRAQTDRERQRAKQRAKSKMRTRGS